MSQPVNWAINETYKRSPSWWVLSRETKDGKWTVYAKDQTYYEAEKAYTMAAGNYGQYNAMLMFHCPTGLSMTTNHPDWAFGQIPTLPSPEPQPET